MKKNVKLLFLMEIKELEIESLVENLENVTLISDENPYFILDNNIQKENVRLHFITEVCLNFYELWTIFRELPNINSDKKIKYSWTFTDKNEKYIIVLCDWMNDKKLLQTRKWRVLSNTNNDIIISKFLKTLCDALECYNRYYKNKIESRDFNSDNMEVDRCLQEIKVSLINNREVLKSL